MKIAIISDIHENFHNLFLFLGEIKTSKCEQIICLGDLMNNGVAKTLAASEIPVFMVWGNNDGDKVAITKTAMEKDSNLSVGFSNYDFLELDGRKLFLTHYPVLAKPMAKSGDFDAVFYGHNHVQNIDKINDCLVVNPGEISAHKTGDGTYAVYDTDANTAEIIEIKNAISLKSELVAQKKNFRFSSTKNHQY